MGRKMGAPAGETPIAHPNNTGTFTVATFVEHFIDYEVFFHSLITVILLTIHKVGDLFLFPHVLVSGLLL